VSPVGDDTGPDPPAHDERRLRAAVRWLAAGGTVGLVAAATTAIAGGGGPAGLAVLLLVWAATTAATGLVVLVVGFVDDVRHRPVTGKRIGVAVGLLVVGFLLLVMGLGAAGAPV